MLLKDMGTTGLVGYVLSAKGSREYHQKMGAAKRTIRARYGAGAVDRFAHAVKLAAFTVIDLKWQADRKAGK